MNYRRNSLMNMVQLDENSGCWNWTGGKDKDGYGKLSWNGRDMRAHRLFAYMFLGISLREYWVLHSCDNPSCVNPKHLFQGTNQDNQIDAVAKGRQHQVRKAYCRNGHPYDEANTYLWHGRKMRQCRICRRAARIRSNRKERLQSI